ncbi:cupin domain-containing protein [bacterium]|nr:cupin domain-containing protein [bacterium]
MKGFKINIEKATKENADYRRVLYTASHSQLVLMNIKPGGEIGEEVHKLDQFIRIEEGEGKAVLDGEEYSLSANDAIIIPQGTRHNIVNMGSADLKLYTVYSPPEHKDGTVQKTKADEKEEHFDGITTQ